MHRHACEQFLQCFVVLVLAFVYVLLAWLSVWSEVKMIYIWSSWCHCRLIVSCFIKIQIGLAFLVPAYPGCPGKRPLNGLSVCFAVLTRVTLFVFWLFFCVVSCLPFLLVVFEFGCWYQCDCQETLLSKMTYCVSRGMLNSAHSVIFVVLSCSIQLLMVFIVQVWLVPRGSTGLEHMEKRNKRVQLANQVHLKMAINPIRVCVYDVRLLLM